MNDDERETERLRRSTVATVGRMLRTEAVPEKDRVEFAGLMALNTLDLLVDALADEQPCIDEFSVVLLEKARALFGIGAAYLYEPISRRPLSPAARKIAVSELGRESDANAVAVLERLERRSLTAEDRKAIRREKLRSGTNAIQPSVRSTHTTATAELSTLDDVGGWELRLHGFLADGRPLDHTAVVNGTGASHRSSIETDGPPEVPIACSVPISPGQALTLLESLPAQQLNRLGAVLDRLRDIAPEPLPRAAPGEPLSMEDARSLVVEEDWRQWRPFQMKVAWEAGSIDRASARSPSDFPGPSDELGSFSAADVQTALSRPRFSARISKGLDFMALRMSIKNDSRAPAVARAALDSARSQVTTLARALVERERWLQLWLETSLPEAWRNQLSHELAMLAGSTELDLVEDAQEEIELTVRRRGVRGWASGLPAPATLDLGGALAEAKQDQTAESPPR